MATCSGLGELLEVLGIRCHDDIYVLRAANHTPCIYGQAAHDDKFHLCGSEAPQQLVEVRLAQLFRADPVNCINLWLSAIPSARFTLIARAASSRSLWTLIASASASAEAGFSRSVMDADGTAG